MYIHIVIIYTYIYVHIYLHSFIKAFGAPWVPCPDRWQPPQEALAPEEGTAAVDEGFRDETVDSGKPVDDMPGRSYKPLEPRDPGI